MAEISIFLRRCPHLLKTISWLRRTNSAVTCLPWQDYCLPILPHLGCVQRPSVCSTNIFIHSGRGGGSFCYTPHRWLGSYSIFFWFTWEVFGNSERCSEVHVFLMWGAWDSEYLGLTCQHEALILSIQVVRKSVWLNLSLSKTFLYKCYFKKERKTVLLDYTDSGIVALFYKGGRLEVLHCGWIKGTHAILCHLVWGWLQSMDVYEWMYTHTRTSSSSWSLWTSLCFLLKSSSGSISNCLALDPFWATSDHLLCLFNRHPYLLLSESHPGTCSWPVSVLFPTWGVILAHDLQL